MTSSSELLRAVRAVLAASLPGTPRAPRSSLDAVLGARGDTLRGLSRSELSEFVLALISSRLEAGLVTEAVHLAERTALRMLQSMSADWSATCQSASYAVITQAELLSGQLPTAARYSQLALDYARECGDARLVLHSLSLRAAALALHGEIEAAQDPIEQGCALGLGGETEVGQRCWPMALAVMAISVVRTDPLRIQLVCDALATNSCNDAQHHAVQWLGQCLRQLVNREFRETLASVESGTRMASAEHFAPYLVDLGVAAGALAALQLGRPGEALSLASTRHQIPGHPICFDALRATGYLQLGDARKALAVTEACVHDIPDHSPLTFCEVLVRRAAALEMLGNQASADASFSKAVHIAHEFGAATSALASGVPLNRLRNLYLRLAEHEPDFADLLAPTLASGAEFSDPTPLDFEPARLTKREATLAYWLTSDLPLTAIATKMHVSINTVKTQARSLYAKLEASSRAEAVDHLERTGLYHGTAPDQLGD
jgi:DNA-binding CsgD family transcriptional regulator